jgi:hypothetical protein
MFKRLTVLSTSLALPCLLYSSLKWREIDLKLRSSACNVAVEFLSVLTILNVVDIFYEISPI